MRVFRQEELQALFKKKAYPLNSNLGEINIFGVRNEDPNSNTFDDAVGVLYYIGNDLWVAKQWTATTDPGLYYRQNPMNIDGTAIIVPGFYKEVYKVGLHTGYEAMEQIAPIVYVRDNNKDGKLDWLYRVVGYKKFKEIGKTNIHHAGAASTQVDKWSAGCQVFASIVEFKQFMNIVKGSETFKTKNKFDYTLFELRDFDS